MRNQTSKITFCSLIAALSMVFMILTFLPSFTYALPGIAGAILVIVVIEVSIKYALISYFVVSVLSIFLVPDKFSVVLYICFFGYYPIIKALFEKIKSNFVLWVCKFLSFNIVFISIYFLSIGLLNLQDNKLIAYSKGYIGLLILLLANIVFLIYDLAIDNVVGFYIKRMHSSVIRIFK